MNTNWSEKDIDHDDDPCELWLSPLFVDPLIMEETALGPYWTNGSAFDEQKGAKYLLKQKNIRAMLNIMSTDLDRQGKASQIRQIF